MIYNKPDFAIKPEGIINCRRQLPVSCFKKISYSSEVLVLMEEIEGAVDGRREGPVVDMVQEVRAHLNQFVSHSFFIPRASQAQCSV